MHRLRTHTAAAAAASFVLATAASGCLDRPIAPIEPRTTSTFTLEVAQRDVDKIDILLTIDDSGSMADKQQILSRAVPHLVRALVNPPCIADDPTSGLEPVTPDGPSAPCPEAMHRRFEPVLDIHVGLITSSVGLGDTGYCIGSCAKDLTRRPKCPDAGAHLQPPVPGTTDPALGFLAWDAEAAADETGLATLRAMVERVGESGCGYEHPLESWYRFLVDPEPYEKLEIVDNKLSVPIGVDQALVAERAAFLRPDSLVAIVMLSDENDCSLRYGYGWMMAHRDLVQQTGFKARAICAADPASPCCAPCGTEVAASCGVDPTCSDPTPSEAQKDPVHLSCWDQKRRFGMDLRWPADRYVKGLTSAKIENAVGEPVDNPLLVGPGGRLRDPSLVFLLGIVGVPVEQIARDPSDIGKGLLTAAELDAAERWAQILGDPATFRPPADAHMRESVLPRDGLPKAGSGAWDPVHGHEHEKSDLQYACIFDLPPPWEQCSATDPSCDCQEGNEDPLCLTADGAYATEQRRAKAYPGLRQLDVLHGVGAQGVVGSICARQVADESKADYGYTPAVGALVDRLADKLRAPCLPRALARDARGQVACLLIEGRPSAGGCGCEAPRSDVPSEHAAALALAKAEADHRGLAPGCFCEIEQLAGDSLAACQNELAPEAVHGWCYVDATTSPPVGDPALVADCPSTEKRLIRLVGDAEVATGGHLFIVCNTE
jgi:hypothetical protein